MSTSFETAVFIHVNKSGQVPDDALVSLTLNRGQCSELVADLAKKTDVSRYKPSLVLILQGIGGSGTFKSFTMRPRQHSQFDELPLMRDLLGLHDAFAARAEEGFADRCAGHCHLRPDLIHVVPMHTV